MVCCVCHGFAVSRLRWRLEFPDLHVPRLKRNATVASRGEGGNKIKNGVKVSWTESFNYSKERHYYYVCYNLGR